MENTMESKWWEGYLVRYLVGTAIGTAISLAIAESIIRNNSATYDLPSLLQSKAADTTVISIALVICGFCYCYMASAPLTVFHATRMLNCQSPLGIRPTRMWLSWMVFGAFYLAFSVYASYTNSGMPDSTEIFLGWLVTPSIYICWSQLIRISELCLKETQSDKFKKYYTALSASRSSACQETMSKRSDFRESYTRLREHANSLFIVVCEISLGCAIVLALSSFETIQQKVATLILMICIWISPNILLWGLANDLERSLKDVS